MKLRCTACGCYVSGHWIAVLDYMHHVNKVIISVEPCKRCLHKAKLAGLEIFSKRNCV